jgi:hypothetical protein
MPLTIGVLTTIFYSNNKSCSIRSSSSSCAWIRSSSVSYPPSDCSSGGWSDSELSTNSGVIGVFPLLREAAVATAPALFLPFSFSLVGLDTTAAIWIFHTNLGVGLVALGAGSDTVLHSITVEWCTTDVLFGAGVLGWDEYSLRFRSSGAASCRAISPNSWILVFLSFWAPEFALLILPLGAGRLQTPVGLTPSGLRCPALLLSPVWMPGAPGMWRLTVVA